MEQRGRKSGAAQAIAVERWENRLPPPDGLTDAQSERWRAIVASKAPDYFDAGVTPLLTEYVLLETDIAMVNQLLRSYGPAEVAADHKTWGDLVARRDTMQNRMVRIATSLRITNQARYHPTTAGHRDKPPGKKPWESA